jgi:chaperone required for assembly of F1-ATPase
MLTNLMLLLCTRCISIVSQSREAIFADEQNIIFLLGSSFESYEVDDPDEAVAKQNERADAINNHWEVKL